MRHERGGKNIQLREWDKGTPRPGKGPGGDGTGIFLQQNPEQS